METLEIEKIKVNDAKVLAEATLETINDIHEYVEFNEYQYKNNVNPSFIDEEELKSEIMNLSLNQRKKLKRAINAFRIKGSLQSVNRFYHFIMKKVLKSDTRIGVIFGKKQLEIVAKRKKFVAARNEMLKMRNEYHMEKADFYKLRIANGQKLQ
ncbi:unnamed protein product [marine sediment metagenome]|jgi:hypothetical protein|uniref:Uncharacterized protein n=1 Tax=marine sediment metagenome TaxID=412755 RepID=X0Y4K8_9ZZZZ